VREKRGRRIGRKKGLVRVQLFYLIWGSCKFKSRKLRALSHTELRTKCGKSPAKMNKQILLCDEL